MNAHPNESGVRNDRDALLSMRDAARPVLEAVERHGSLHLVLVGTLRVHPQATPEEPFYSSQSSLAPRDIAAEGQLGLKNERLTTPPRITSQCGTLLKCSRMLPNSGSGNGILHQFAQDSIFGWLSVPGDGTQVKDFIHIMDVIEIIMHVLQNPPLTRETLCIGSGEAMTMSDVAAIYQERTGCDPQYGNDDSNEVWVRSTRGKSSSDVASDPRSHRWK